MSVAEESNFDRQPPQDVAAEQSVLGGMLLSKDAIADVVKVVRVVDFYRPAHQIIYDAILDLYGRGVPADSVTVLAKLGRTGQLILIGGAPYLHTLISAVPTAANAGYYAEIVAERATLRRLVEAGTRIVQLGYGAAAGKGGDVDQVVDRAQAEIGLLSSSTAQAETCGPSLVRLDDLLAEPDEEVRYRIDRLWPIGGRVMFVAQYKAGKTTTVGNLVRSLVDGDPFLGSYPVAVTAGPVVVLDDELDPRTIRRWYRDQGIQHTQQVWVASLRGQLHTLDLTDSLVVDSWAERLAALGAAVLVLDCLSPALASLGLDENSTGDVRRFLAGFDALLLRAGIGEGVVVHHMGHQAERGRGASGLRDWPDAEWTLVREKPDDPAAEADPSAPRYFKAYGRDVDEPEQRLNYDPATRQLTIGGTSRRGEKRDRHVPAVVEVVAKNPGVTRNGIIEELVKLGVSQVQAKGAVPRAVELAAVRVEDGPNRSHCHYPNPVGHGGLTGRSTHQWGGGSLPIGDPPPPPAPAPRVVEAQPSTCLDCGGRLDPVIAADLVHPGCDGTLADRPSDPVSKAA